MYIEGMKRNNALLKAKVNFPFNEKVPKQKYPWYGVE